MRGPPAPLNEVPDLVAALSRAATTGRGLTFVSSREEESRLGFRELQMAARRAAAALRRRGVNEGDRVALVLPTGPEFVELFFGIVCAGAVPVPLYPPVRLGRRDEYQRTTARMLSAVGARLLVTDEKSRPGLGDSRLPLGSETAAALLAEAAGFHEVAPGGGALGLIQFSSGSTVDPKPVALSHFNLVSQCAALKAALVEPSPGAGVGVSWLPLYHDMGLIGCLLMAVYYPGNLVLLPPEAFLARPALWLRAISRHRGTHSPAPNFAFELCLRRILDEQLSGVDLSCWTYALNGAEPISARAAQRFSDRFSRFGFDPSALRPVYGLSEASLAVTFSPRRAPVRTLPLDAERRAIASVGVPLPGVEVEVRGEKGLGLADGRVGRVFVRGPSVMSGYFGAKEATARALEGGWLDTGDLGLLSGGELYLCGRAKDLVIIRGVNHAPEEFEDCLESMEGVRPGCAVALGFLPEGSESEALLVLAELQGPDDDGALAERIRAAILERTGIRPHTVALLAPGALPRTSSGKLRRRESLRRYLVGELRAPRPDDAALRSQAFG